MLLQEEGRRGDEGGVKGRKRHDCRGTRLHQPGNISREREEKNHEDTEEEKNHQMISKPQKGKGVRYE